jgi:precorrin-3B C17-methyltransferase
MTISVVGISYSNQSLSQEAIEALGKASAAIGHVDFIAQVRPFLEPSVQAFDVLDDVRTGETFLTARVRRALELHKQGLDVVVLSGGDPGVFGMGGAVLDQINSLSGAELTDQVRIIPGLSAYQLAAAIIGSPLNGGFATLALCIDSVPVETIDRQISGIAATNLACVVFMLRHNAENYPDLYPDFGDAVGFSRSRVASLIAQFRRARAGQTPVVVASRLGAPDQEILYLTLDTSEDAFESMGEESVLFICDEASLKVGSRLVMPTW